MDLLPFAREFLFPKLGLISKGSDGTWCAWRFSPEENGMRLVLNEAGTSIARFSDPAAAHAALQGPVPPMGPHLSLSRREEMQ
jgi:hypothetical protein